MNPSIYYCKSWFRAQKRPTEIWTEEKANSAHLEQKLYTVIVASIEKPFCFLDIGKGLVGVGFLDKYIREYMTFAFQEVKNEKLFLTMATYREFEGETDKVTSGTSYIYEIDGKVKIRREIIYPHQLDITEDTCNINKNYVKFPEFGQYDDFINFQKPDFVNSTY